jgi:hypothetical protein
MMMMMMMMIIIIITATILMGHKNLSFTARKINITVFLYVTPCSLADNR